MIEVANTLGIALAAGGAAAMLLTLLMIYMITTISPGARFRVALF